MWFGASICPTVQMEGRVLIPGIKAAINKVGAQKFIKDLLLVGFFYHTYNQVGKNQQEVPEKMM